LNGTSATETQSREDKQEKSKLTGMNRIFRIKDFKVGFHPDYPEYPCLIIAFDFPLCLCGGL
jgi:hypothetical protein